MLVYMNWPYRECAVRHTAFQSLIYDFNSHPQIELVLFTILCYRFFFFCGKFDKSKKLENNYRD